MHGIIAKITAAAGKRDTLVDILVAGTRDMPGCISYTVAKDTGFENLIWITEVWQSKQHHEASLQLPSVQKAIGKGRPLMAGMEMVASTEPAAT